jgi:hypothetical protein
LVTFISFMTNGVKYEVTQLKKQKIGLNFFAAGGGGQTITFFCKLCNLQKIVMNTVVGHSLQTVNKK